MKRIFKKALICTLVIMLVSNFILYTPGNIVYAGAGLDFIDNLVGGLVGILLWVVKAPLLGVTSGIHAILTAFANIGVGSASHVDGTIAFDAFYITPLHIFFNKIEILDVNFLNLDTSNTVVKTFREAVAGWYYSMRLIASMVLAVILIYIGLRMAISTIASEKAMYKKMLVDWACSLALLFLLHYIMIFVFACNDALIKALGTVTESTDMVSFFNNLREVIFFSPEVWLGIAALVVYAMLVFQTLSFLLTYIKRMLTIGFLIIIAPLITITYSIDKIGDGKAQALNVWLKEFIYNILIQPFHCILYLSFANVAMELLQMDLSAGEGSLAAAVLAILCIQYIKTGEELVKKIFGFDKAGSLATMAAGTAMAMAAMSKGGQVGKTVGTGVAKTARFIGRNKEFQNLKNSIGNRVKNSGTAKKVKNATNSLKESANKTAVGRKISNGISNVARRKNEKREEKINKQMEKNLGTELYQKIVAGQDKGGKERYDQERKRAEEQVAKRANTGKKIRGAVGKVGAVPFGIARDAGKYVLANKSKIAQIGVGAVIGAMGLSTGSAGMIAGYKMGSGFVEGLLSNSTKTIRNDLSGSAQTISNLTNETDSKKILSLVKAMGDNDAFKDMSKKMDELMANLKKIGLNNENKNKQVLATVSKELIENPSEVDNNTIRQAFSEIYRGTEGFDDEKLSSATSLMSQHAEFMASASLYKAMNSASERGNSLDDIANILGTLTPSADVSVDTSQVDVSQLADEIMREFDPLAERTVSDINGRIRQIEGYLSDIERISNDTQQNQQLISQIRTKTGDNDLDITQVKDRLQAELTSLQNGR